MPYNTFHPPLTSAGPVVLVEIRSATVALVIVDNWA